MKTNARTEAVRLVLQLKGIDPERFEARWVSSAEAPKFVEVVTQFSEKIRRLGPNPLRVKKAAEAC